MKRTADALAPRLSVVFRRLLRLCSFLAFWRQGNGTLILKGSSYSAVANYRPVPITPVFTKAFEHQVSVCLGRFTESSGVLPTTQYSYRKRQGICDALLSVFHTPQSGLERGQEAKIVKIDFRATFGRVNQHEILYKLCSVRIVGYVLSIYTNKNIKSFMARNPPVENLQPRFEGSTINAQQ